MVINDIDLI